MSTDSVTRQERDQYKAEAERLEDYLVRCLSIFEDHEDYDAQAGLTLEGHIKSMMDTPDSPSADQIFIKAVEMSYTDCIRVLQSNADDIEVAHPNNQHIKYMASAYRNIGEWAQSRVVLLKSMDTHELYSLYERGSFE